MFGFNPPPQTPCPPRRGCSVHFAKPKLWSKQLDHRPITQTNCPNCGAPVDRKRCECAYCGTPYVDAGRSLDDTEELRERMKALERTSSQLVENFSKIFLDKSIYI